MNWIINTLGSSIGKKLMMAVTGLCFCGFLAVHLAGNLTLYGGRDLFNAYVEKLHSLGSLITLAELGLLSLALVHVLTGAFLFFQNIAARPVRYSVNKDAGGSTIGSSTMPYTGFIILMFLIYHLLKFHFTDHAGQTVFDIVFNAFIQPVNVVIYIIAVGIAAIHVSHGLWSAFQTIGLDHPKYTPLIKIASIVFGLIVAFGFGFIPVIIYIA